MNEAMNNSYCNLFFSVLFLSGIISMIYVQSWILLATDRIGETHPSGDIKALYFYNDGYFAYFNETLVGAPDTDIFTYAVYLDKPLDGCFYDFRMVFSSAHSELQKWNGTRWVLIENISVTTSNSPYSIVFNVSLSDIANPDVQQNTGVLFVNSVKSKFVGKMCMDLVYGRRNVDVGNVYLFVDDEDLHIEICVDSGWLIKETHLKISKDPLSWSPPGHWPYHHEFQGTVTYDNYTIPISEIGFGDLGLNPPFGVGLEDAVFLMAQASIINIEGVDETAYGCGFKCAFCFGDIASAFISYEVIPELPWPTPLVFVPSIVAVILILYRRRSKFQSHKFHGTS